MRAESCETTTQQPPAWGAPPANREGPKSTVRFCKTEHSAALKCHGEISATATQRSCSAAGRQKEKQAGAERCLEELWPSTT